MDAIFEEIRNRKVVEQTEEEKLEHEIKTIHIQQIK